MKLYTLKERVRYAVESANRLGEAVEAAQTKEELKRAILAYVGDSCADPLRAAQIMYYWMGFSDSPSRRPRSPTRFEL